MTDPKYDTDQYDAMRDAITDDPSAAGALTDAAETISTLQAELKIVYAALSEAQDFGLKIEKENTNYKAMLLIYQERELLPKRY